MSDDLPDDADVLAAVEFAIERDRSRKTEDPARWDARFSARARGADVEYLYGGRGRRVHAHLRRLWRAGLLKRHDDSLYVGFTLSPAGSALAQEGELLCRCGRAGSLEHVGKWSWYPRCDRCEAESLEDAAKREDDSAVFDRRSAAEHEAQAVSLRERAERLRA